MCPTPEPPDAPARSASTPSPAELLGNGDRRVAPRREIPGPVTLEVLGALVETRAQNISPTGLLVTLGAPLRVKLSWTEDGRQHERTGRLARLQRLSADQSGLAIEFDPD
ncbi:MAG: hypothetical protein GC161_02260 [Planctomycetaceae bacterium]|nr:hypothetical protein [Planctomycetaceae bacterium]